MSLSYVDLVRILGTIFCLAGVYFCWRTARTRFGEPGSAPTVNLWVTRLPAESAAKLMAFAGLIAMPAAAMFIANYHVFEGVHEVSGCARCHVMLPMVNDMRDPTSGRLAARHYKNKWIATDQCYHCHSDYGMNGNLEAKMTGFRHLARYTTRTYHEPIQPRVVFDNKNCLNCHAGTRLFEGVPSHQTARERLEANQMICLNCHGPAHPTAAQRTPGSPDYARLMEADR